MILSVQQRFFLMTLLWNWITGWPGMHVLAQVQPDCDFRFNLRFDEQQTLRNPGFDEGRYYDRNKICRWVFIGPPGYVFDLTCNPIDIPGMQNNLCTQDRLLVSPTGSLNLSDSRNYCGTGSIKLESITNALSIGLETTSYTNGGRYNCIITPIRSCNVQPTTPPTTTTTEKPNKCDCGWRQKRRIVGGVETEVNEYVFMAALIDLSTRTVWCGASIISNNYAITAAHCVDQRLIAEFGLLVGDHNIKEATETQPASPALYRLINFIVHENYNTRTNENDIAIVQTETPMIFGVNIGPICLPYRYTKVDFANATVTALGWGSTFFTGPTSDALLEVNLNVTSKADCQAKHRQKIYDTQICTFAPSKDSCTYDSGGPLVWFDKFNTFRYQLLGIISSGSDCATPTPGINTNVPSYVSWILNTTPKEPYCFL